jgi:hypothetical protein
VICNGVAGRSSHAASDDLEPGVDRLPYGRSHCRCDVCGRGTGNAIVNGLLHHLGGDLGGDLAQIGDHRQQRPPYGEDQAPPVIPPPALPLEKIGVGRWQYDLWYRIVLAALAGHPDQVGLGAHPALDLPAVSRYAATTTRLLDWFKSFNAGKPYGERVKPFNFLLMFQASRLALAQARSDVPATALGHLPRAIAPYDPDPAVAVAHCFDRESGEAVPVAWLKTYRQVLAQYHLQPEAKFENGDYLDRGPTRRRHIHAVAVAHIGKEANRWEEQLYLGEDPEAQIDYGASPEAKERLRGSVLELSRPFTAAALARAAGLSTGNVTDILAGRTRPPVETWLKLYQAAQELEAARRVPEEREQRTLDATRAHCRKHGTRAVASTIGLNPGNLSNVLNGKRRPSLAMLTKLESMLAGGRSS